MNYLSRSLQIIKERSLRACIKAVHRFLIWHPILDEIHFIISRTFRSRIQLIRTTLGYRMLVDIYNYGTHKNLFIYQQHEPLCTKIFSSMIPEKSIVLDIGANIGYYVLIEAQKASKIYAIEPALQNIEFLKKNIDLNILDEFIEIYQLAMSDNKDKALLSLDDVPNRYRLVADKSKYYKNVFQVDTTTVDEFLKNRRVDVVRMDIEGAEWLVIRGMTDTLSQLDNVRVLFIELHPTLIKDYGGDALALVNLLLDSNFKIQYIVLLKRQTKISWGYFTKGPLTLQQVLEFGHSSNQIKAATALKKIIENNMDCWLFMER